MTLKKELEILRGEPIKVCEGDPMDIPCIETADTEKLCKHPAVSVQMCTYNHEHYIRRAIEGVVKQKTDFEFELVIGEDASMDKTREICFEYQKRYPDKIRVLWWHENVSKLGGNSRRVFAHCRGEFVAFCEGDDYWIDPLKLQKQVEYIRATDSILCVANSEWHYPNGEIRQDIYRQEKGLLSVEDFFHHYFHTTTYLVSREAFTNCKRYYTEIIYWYDYVFTTLMATLGRVCFLPDVMSVYNWTGCGIGGSPGSINRDKLLALQFTQFAYCSNQNVSMFYSEKAIKFIFSSILSPFSTEGYKHQEEVRHRAWRTARRICGKHFGLAKECKLWIRFWKMSLLTRMKIIYARHSMLGKCWRRIKQFFNICHIHDRIDPKGGT